MFDREKIKTTYSSDECSILHDFYVPALQQAVSYDRAVGFFSASMLTYALQGIQGFVKNKGRMRLIVGEELSDEEYEAVKAGHQARLVYERFDIHINELFDSCEDELLNCRLHLLGLLVSCGSLEIKLAVRRRGMYHEKIGIMRDADDNVLVFQGSANETNYALLPDFNFESISVYPSWKHEVFAEYGMSYIDRFERLWNNQLKNTLVVALPNDSYENIQQRASKKTVQSQNELDIYEELQSSVQVGIGPRLPILLHGVPYAIKNHQIDALKQWEANDFRGIFALATGAGKTITAIHGVVQIARAASGKVAVVVSVPYQILADQWVEVMRLFNIDAICCYKSKSDWYTELDTQISDFNLLSSKRFLAVVVVNATMQRTEFQGLIKKVPSAALIFIGDECHHHGNDRLVSKLPNARFRIGLSATPWSEREEERQRTLKSYYGGVVAKYTIKDALSDEVLTPYEYNLHLIELTDEETLAYGDISAEISVLVARKESGESIDEDYLTARYMARARLIGSAEDKFRKLKSYLKIAPISQHTLFYCGDGSTEADVGYGALRDVERVALILHDLGWKSSRFTADESYSTRGRILSNFKSGVIDSIVAIRVLDEGFDIPSCHQAFLLASSRNERQFIQRRGRILRRSSGKSISVIHDFLVMPAAYNTGGCFTELVRQELLRAAEFCRVALNYEDCKEQALEVAKRYQIEFDDLETTVSLREYD